MSATSIGSLLAGTAAKVTANIGASVSAGIWRNSYDVNDPRAKVGRPFGDGSIAQSLGFMDALEKALKRWGKKNKSADLTNNMIETLVSTFRSSMNFATGAC